MAKKCGLCGKKFGLLTGRIALADGEVCLPCWSKTGLGMEMQDVYRHKNKTIRQLQTLIEREILLEEAAQTGIADNPAPKKARKTGPAKKKTAPKKEPEALAEEKPIDIFIEVDEQKRVIFVCDGEPVINFDDMVNGREMIIGDGFIENRSGVVLPEIRVVCEFDPPVIDTGMLYYEKGTFVIGAEGRFEIDDPPVNLEEYAKVKREKKGKAKFTLYFGEDELGQEECSMRIKPAPEKKLQDLMDAILYKEEKNAAGPVNVFLYATESDGFKMDLMRKPELLYSMYSNGKEQLIGDVFVSNDTPFELKNLQFEATFTSDILAPMHVHLGSVPPGEKTAFEVDDPAVDVAKLEMLTEIETCTATYRILIGDKVVSEATGRITICPYNQWNAALILLPAYMTPNHPNVINVLQHASKWMLVNGLKPSLEGYQSDPGRIQQMISAVYNSVKEANIFYSNPPASFFGPQRIRLCDTVFEQKFATCLDMTILFASCLESFGLHPVLITAPGHIFAGVWLTERGRLQEPIVSNASLIQKYIKEGKLVAIECTAMNAGKDISYGEAKRIANDTIQALVDNKVENHECIDVQIARALGVRPLPIRVQQVKPVQFDEPVAIKGMEIPVELKEDETEETKPEIVKGNVEVDEIEEELAEPCFDGPGYNKVDYVSFADDLSHISSDNFYDKQTRKVLKEAIAEIVAVEGPISQPTLIRTLINATSLGRVSKQISEHLDKLVAAADVKITRQNGVRFLWEQGTDPAAYMSYRFKEQRSPEDICKYELRNAVCYLIQKNGAMTKAEIAKAMVGMFGYSRSSKKLEDGAAVAIKAARELKAVTVIEDGRLTLL